MSYSVVIPAFNAAETIAETLGSVLAQSVPAAEIIVVDDGSTDETARVAAAATDRVRVLRQENAGPGAACNRAIRAASCPVIATLDADDLWLPHKMERQLQALAAAPARALVFARHRLFRPGTPDTGTGEERPGLTRSDMVVPRALFDEVGDIVDPAGRRGEMVDWLARAREAGCAFVVLDEVLVLRRILPGSLSHGRDAARDRGYLAAAHQAMQRRRARNGGAA